MPDQTSASETARALLDRHGLPEDVVDGALALHAQELAAVQRREAAVWGVDTAAGKHILGAADLIDPVRGALPAAVPVPPPADQTALRDRIAEAIRDAACPGDCGNREEECAKERIQPFAWHHGGLAIVEGTPEQFAEAVLAALPEQTDQTAEALAAIRPQTLTALASHIDARSVSILRPDSQTYAEWQAVATLLRRVAAEEQPAETQNGEHVSRLATVLREVLATFAPMRDTHDGPVAYYDGSADIEPEQFARWSVALDGVGPCACIHPADEHSVYGCADGCGCEWMPKPPAVGEQPETQEAP